MRNTWFFCLAVAFWAMCAWGQQRKPVTTMPPEPVKSPDGAILMQVAADNGQLAYSVTFGGESVVLPSALGLELEKAPVLGASVRIAKANFGVVNESYTMLLGKSNPVRNRYHWMTLDLEETAKPHRRLQLETRAYNDGVAFRYVVPQQGAIESFRLLSEKTEFRLAKDGTTYPLILESFHTAYEDNYHVLPLSGLHPDYLIALPLLAELPGVAWVAITEADIDNYAGMYLQHSEHDGRLLTARLAPSVEDPGLAVHSGLPARSPWRVLMIGAQPGRLVESNIVINLNPPSAIADTSWIKPGKTAWDWWSGDYAEGVSFKPGMNTATMEHYIDFSAEAGLAYMLIDAGWAAKSSGANDSGSDITRNNAAVDLPAILDYAKARKVRIWLWAHWSDVNRQMDEAFPLYEKWGVAGVKIDFMNRDDQWMVNFYRQVVQTAAEHHLMIDFHGAFKPDGLRRTYPNLLTREGVMGAEYNKWSGRVTPDHNLTLAFTRMLAGPMDYTPGGFHNATLAEFEPRNVKPMVMGTRAHQLALYVVFESGLQMLADYPEAYRDQTGFEFLKAVPNVWDETRVVGGRPGEYITVARRRGGDWYVGSITGWHAGTVDLPLDFLGHGEFLAEIYSDAPDAGSQATHTVKDERRVTAATTLRVKMVAGGGQAIRLRPAH
ncbi:MAG: glycoside hydrolase family 97 protein [Bryobacteraceae bacterium]